MARRITPFTILSKVAKVVNMLEDNYQKLRRIKSADKAELKTARQLAISARVMRNTTLYNAVRTGGIDQATAGEDFGITGFSSTATARSDSAAVYRIVASRACDAGSSPLATFHGSCSVK